jgi:hypothetical protein
MNVYECSTTGCTLGSRATKGRFTGGATKEQITNLTGDPEPEHFGEGVCPNCGEPGELLDEEYEVAPEGNDPHQEIHDQVAARVADDQDELTAENAQAVVNELVEAKEGNGAEEVEAVETVEEGDKQ